MKAGNHVAGGLVITGFFASLWNINIFHSVDTLVFTSIASLLPDIDHSKSLIGKSVYPLARWIDRNYGHRTITHSLLFILAISMISFIIEKYFSDTYTYSTILFFSVFSHYILDMVTIQGIPLFYPFYRNPCVIPGNPSMRISTNDTRSELIAFSIFLIIGLTSIDLFKNGFWTSYNRAFGTLKHLHQENFNTDDLLICEYDFFKNGKKYKGSAYVIQTTSTKAILFDNKILTLDKKDNSILINEVKPLHTSYKKEIRELGFFNISFDSLKKILSNKIVSGQIQSNKNLQYIKNNISHTAKILKLDFDYNFNFYLISDSIKTNYDQQIKINELKLEQDKLKYQLKVDDINKIKVEINKLRRKVSNTSDLYLKDKFKSMLITLNSELETKKNNLGTFKVDPLILYDIEILKNKKELSETYFSGLITYQVLPHKIFVGKIKYVFDGDTFILETSSEKINVRMYGIDAPEISQFYGKESANFLKQFIGKKAKVIPKLKDEYSRTIGTLYVDDNNICIASLKNGFSWHYKYFSNDINYKNAELSARKNKSGMWRFSNNVPPWEYRYNDRKK